MQVPFGDYGARVMVDDPVFATEGFGLDYPFLDLVNSEQWDGLGRRSDHLADAAWVVAFLERWGWANTVGGDPAPQRELERLRALLRGIVEALTAGGAVPRDGLDELNGVLGVTVRRRLEAGDQGLAVAAVPSALGWPWVMAEIVASLGVLGEEGGVRRLKVCPNPGCRWAFYDRSHGNSRRWCRDLTCGNRDRVRRFRQRQRGAAG